MFVENTFVYLLEIYLLFFDIEWPAMKKEIKCDNFKI